MSYGLQTTNSNGTIGINSDEVAVRFISSVKLNRTYSGVISVPNFDSNRGTYFLTPYVIKYKFDTSVRVADSTPLGGGTYVNLMNQYGTANVTRFSSPKPTLSWDNTTKQMTVTASASALGDYKLSFLHYK